MQYIGLKIINYCIRNTKETLVTFIINNIPQVLYIQTTHLLSYLNVN